MLGMDIDSINPSFSLTFISLAVLHLLLEVVGWCCGQSKNKYQGTRRTALGNKSRSYDQKLHCNVRSLSHGDISNQQSWEVLFYLWYRNISFHMSVSALLFCPYKVRLAEYIGFTQAWTWTYSYPKQMLGTSTHSGQVHCEPLFVMLLVFNEIARGQESHTASSSMLSDSDGKNECYRIHVSFPEHLFQHSFGSPISFR